jgi:hypothetical protein
MKKDEKQKQANPVNELEFEEILETLLKVKPPEKKKPVKKEKSKPKK